MDTVKKGMSMKRAAIKCKVPRSTLNNRQNQRKCSTISYEDDAQRSMGPLYLDTLALD